MTNIICKNYIVYKYSVEAVELHFAFTPQLYEASIAMSDYV